MPYSAALLYDEPMAGLDAENALIVHRLLRKAVDDAAAVLLATHEQGAEEFADCVMQSAYRTKNTAWRLHRGSGNSRASVNETHAANPELIAANSMHDFS